MEQALTEELELHKNVKEARLNIPTNNALKERIKALAGQMKRSESWLVREMIWAYLTAQPEQAGHGQALLGQGSVIGSSLT